MPSWGDLLGKGSVAEQLVVWGVLNQLLGDVFGPFLQLVTEKVNEANPVFQLSPSDAAEAVVRNFMDRGAGAGEAARSGINADRFQTLVHLAGDAPGPQELAEALRRQIIPEGGTGADSTSFEQGIAEGRLGDKWGPTIKALSVIWPTPTDALQALLEGQIDEATARELYQRFGGDLDYFQMLFDSRGQAPTPNEGLQMLRRGIIAASGTGPDATSYQQLFLEGPWRNKWLPAFQALAVELPPSRTVVALLKSGAIDDRTAQSIWQQNGLSPAMSAAYAKSARGEKLAGTRQLAESTVLTLYETGALTEAEASTHLAALGYDQADVAFMLAVTDLQRTLRTVNSGITRVGTLYVGHRITRKAAQDAVLALGVTATHADSLLAVWDTEAAANVKLLTAPQVESAFEHGIMDQATATAELVAMGYTAYDAWVLLSIKAKGPIADQPPVPVGGPGTVP